MALFGRFLSGKTTLATELADVYGYRRVSLAHNLKAITQEVYGTLDKGALVEVTDRYGVPSDKTIRSVLQGLGESVKVVDRDFWLRWFLKDMENVTVPLVVDDGRLIFEADELRYRGWTIVKVEVPDEVRLARYQEVHHRYPSPAELTHATETQLDEIKYDYVLDGQLDVELTADLLIGMLDDGWNEPSISEDE